MHIFIIIFTIFSSAYASHIEIPFRLHEHLIVIEGGSIGDLNDLNFVLDTGASTTVVHPRVAKVLGLEGSHRYVNTYGRKQRVSDVVLPNINFGGIEFEETQAVIAPIGLERMSSRLRVDALIGLSLLKNTSLTIDYANRILTFGPVEFEGPYTPFYGKLPLIPIPIKLGDHWVHLSLDTGASDIILYRENTREKLQARQTSEKRSFVFTGGSVVMRKVILSELGIEDLMWAEISAFVIDGNSPQVRLDGLLGVMELGLEKLHLDFTNNRVGWER